MALIKSGDTMTERGALAESLARAALVWQPTNHFAWALWRDALAAQSTFEAAVDFGWETIRRFPENVQWRNQLADLLARLPDRDDEAEAVLREAVHRFPDNVVARNQLAELLIDGGRIKDAIAAVKETKAAGLSNAVTVDLEARLLAHEELPKDAAAVLKKGCADYPSNPILAHHRNMLRKTGTIPLQGAGQVAKRNRSIDVPDASHSRQTGTSTDPVLLAGHLRKLAFDTGKRQELAATLAADPNFAYALYLRNSPAESAGVFAAKIAEAVKAKDASALNALERSHASEAKIIDFARALALRDEAAASRCAAWVAPASTGQSHSLVTLQSFLKLRFGERLAQSLSGTDFIAMIAANGNMEEDLIESVVAGIDIPIAA